MIPLLRAYYGLPVVSVRIRGLSGFCNKRQFVEHSQAEIFSISAQEAQFTSLSALTPDNPVSPRIFDTRVPR